MSKQHVKSAKFLRMQNIRRFVQLFFLLLFLWLLFSTVYGKPKLPVELFFRLDPLAGLSAMLASRSIIGSIFGAVLVVLVFTMVFGRFFCGWLCPMGTLIDITDRFIIRKKEQNEVSTYRQIKFYLLGALAVSALFSAQLVYLFDPFGILYRGFIWLLISPVFSLLRFISSQEFLPSFISSIGDPPTVPEEIPFYRLGLVSGAMFFGTLALGAVQKRFWCRNLCPLGALLSLVGRFGFIRRIVGESDCINCKQCSKHCKMGAILPEPSKYLSSECIYCFNCTQNCKPGTHFSMKARSEGFVSSLDLSRRYFLASLGAGILYAFGIAASTNHKKANDGKTSATNDLVIRPPGSVAEDMFIDRCVRCSLCIKTCPTNALQPAIAEAGTDGFMTPVVVPRIGYCMEHCNLCSEVCPTKAIEPYKLQDKRFIAIGKAWINRSTCLEWAYGQECLVCDEHCSYHAIRRTANGPIVDMRNCIGCGQCENKCPIQPIAAIRVAPQGNTRGAEIIRREGFQHHRGWHHNDRELLNKEPSEPNDGDDTQTELNSYQQRRRGGQ